MKKLVGVIMGVIITGATVMNVSAEEYEVQKGDSLWDIAEEYNTTIDDLVEINGLGTTVIQPRQKLFISETYIVEKDDTLIEIGNEFDVTVEDIKEWNDLRSNIIVIGQELEIHGTNNVQEEKESKKTQSSEKSSAQAKEVSKSTDSAEGKTISVSATAYTAGCDGCSGITATGVDLNADPNAKVIAVDPNVIPLGSKVHVEGYGTAIAADTGGAIKGNKIDIHVPTKDKAYNWGVRTVNVTILK